MTIRSGNIRQHTPGADRRHWLLLLPLLAALSLFFIGGPDWLSPTLYRSAWSQGHVLYFFFLVLWLMGFVALGTPWRWLGMTLTVVVLSIAIEGLQSLVDRSANWHDVLRNVLGAWLALFWGLPATRRVWAGRLVLTGLVGWQLVGVAGAALDYHHRWRHFPTLSDFEHARDLHAWRGSVRRVSTPVIQGAHSLAVSLGTTRYSGITLAHTPRDWTGYEYLCFSLHNPDPEALALTLRINDRHHYRRGGHHSDRYNQALVAGRGWNHYRISLDTVRQAPADRYMDLRDIHRLGLFASRLSSARSLYVDDVRLVSEQPAGGQCSQR